MKTCVLVIPFLAILPVQAGFAAPHEAHEVHGGHAAVPDSVIEKQRHSLAENTKGKGFGPQSPRDIDSFAGTNPRRFSPAPAAKKMNLCNIHFHKSAEHRGGEFRLYAGNGDGHGYGSGYKYSGQLSAAEKRPVGSAICPSPHGALEAGDTIEVHYVYTTASVKPGPSLGACMNEAAKNPQLRVEAEVYVLVNDRKAADFRALTQVENRDGYYQAVNLPDSTGRPVVYAGSTTGPGYNEKGSPYEVTWSVHPKVAKVDILTVGEWCKSNMFEEDHAHGVRNLVVNPALLSRIDW